MLQIHRGRCAGGFAALALAMAMPVPALALDIVEFTFGNGTGTDQAQTVATHLQATPVVGRNSQGQPAPHQFVDLGGGNMAMQLKKSDGGYWFDFTLTADPGWTFQVNDAHFALRATNTAGSNRNISAWPNADPKVTWYDTAGGDLNVTDLGPGDFGWKGTAWAAFAARTDLQTLRITVSLKGNSGGSIATFDRVLLQGQLLPVPEPPAALLAAAGLAVLTLRAHIRQVTAHRPAPTAS
jgi:hypothetical protein